MANIGTLTAHLGLETKDFDRNAAAAKSKIAGLASNFGGTFVAMAAGAVSIGAVGKFLKDSAVAAMESERAFASLGAAVQKHGGTWAAVSSTVQSFATDMQRATGISDEAIAGSLQLFIDFGADGRQAMDRVRVAADLAAGTNMDLAAATMLLAKASTGSTEALGRYGFKVDEAIPKSERYAALLKLITDRMGGRALANAETLAGRINILTQEFDAFQEQVGGLTVGPLTSLVTGLTDILTVVNSNITAWDKLKIAAKVWFAPIAGVAGFFMVKDALADISEEASKARLQMLAAHDVFGMPKAAPPPSEPDPDAIRAEEERLQKIREQNLEAIGNLSRFTADDVMSLTAEMDALIKANDEFNMSFHKSFTPTDEWEENRIAQLQEEFSAVEALYGSHGSNLLQWAESISGEMNDVFADSFFGVLKGEFDKFGDFLKSFVTSVTDVVLNSISQMLAGQLSNTLVGAFAGASGHVAGSQIGGAGPMTPVEFARGGLVTRPTFAMIGEAGPEAVIPLAKMRDQKFLESLGAGSGGGETTVVFNISTPDVQSFKASQSQIMSQTAVALSRAQRNA